MKYIMNIIKYSLVAYLYYLLTFTSAPIWVILLCGIPFVIGVEAILKVIVGVIENIKKDNECTQ
jgi:hypothetical protein